ncbi:TonB-dependent receptor domain-containing protein [Myxococcus landrumensis]|uniref:TonB-dependent receptor domain-containing protein n=1 Tax=Myxococcus landrumensis TaxID=2813577 RepID=UPI001F508D38|nr:TonB-dependent receptor [Myxococcus landrumus]
MVPSAPQVVEFDIQTTDAGLSISESPHPGEDAGTVELIPPTLVTHSPARHPEGLEDTTTAVPLELLVDEQGAVSEARVTESLDPRFSAAALSAAQGLRFSPARLRERPVAVRMRFVYYFQGRAQAPPRAWIHGHVRARGSRRPLLDATLHISGQSLPISPDAQGDFELPLPTGPHTIEVRAPGYKPTTFQETLTDGQRLTVIYRLEPLRLNPYETLVRDERPRTEVTRITLHEQEIREVPGTQGDPFRVVMLMPGVGGLASGLGHPVIRGGQPASTGFFLDGVRVPTLYHLFVGPAVVQPEFIDTLDFHPGAPPVQYGRLLGGVVEGRVSRPREDRLHVSAALDFINSSLLVEVPIASTGTHVTLAGRVSYTGLLLTLASKVAAQKGAESIDARFWDYQARIEQRVGDGRLRLLALGSSDTLAERAPTQPQRVPGLDIPQDPIDGVGVLSRFHRMDLRGTHPLAGGELEVGLTAGLDALSFTWERGPPRVPIGEYTLREQSLAGRLRWTRELGQTLRLALGGDLEHRRATVVARGNGAPVGSTYFDDDDPLTRPTSEARLSSAFAEVRWAPSPDWMVVPGVRVDAYQLLGEVTHTTLEPRLAVRHALTQTLVLKAGAGLFHQAPTVLVHMPVMDTSALRHGLQEALQFDVGAEWKPHEAWEFNADVFYNPLLRSVEFDVRQALNLRRRGVTAEPPPTASGEAYGFELMARHPLGGNWFGWASYSFLQSRRRLRIDRYDDQNQRVASEEATVPFAFEQAHVFNAALSYKFDGGYTVGAVLHFNTGRPETGELTPHPMRAGLDDEGQPKWVRQDRDKVGRLPSYWRVDLRAAKAWALDDLTLELSLDLLNASLQQEVLFYEYVSEQTAPESPPTLRRAPRGFPVILPMLGLKGTY